MKCINSSLRQQLVIYFQFTKLCANHKFRNFYGVAAMALVAPLVLSIFSNVAWAQTYYIDATNGNDSWQGSLPDAQGANGPWKTLSKVNETNLSPGDSVLLKCGQKWNETLIVTNSGVAGSPITFGAYGGCTGSNKPIIDGGAPVIGWTDAGNGIYSATFGMNKTPLNLIANDLFDSGVTGWSVWSEDGGATVSLMPNCSATGGCLAFKPSPGKPSSLITTPIQFGVETNVTYKLTFVARGSQATNSLWVFPRDGKTYANIVAGSSHALTTGWQTYSIEFTSPVSLSSARVDFQMPTGTDLYLDNVMLKRVTPEPALTRQVFIDGQYQRLAQHPNKGFMPERPTNEFLSVNNACSGGPTTSLSGGNDLTLTAPQQADLVGAGIHFRSNAWTIEDRTITAFDANTKTFTWATNSAYDICKDWGYYLDNKLWMLDSAGEWYYDTVARQLYLKPGTGTPEGRVVVGYRDYGVFANGRAYITIDGLNIVRAVTGISAQIGSNLIIRNTDISDSEDKAINVTSSPDSEIVGCHVTNSVRDGIWMNYSPNAHIVNNVVLNTGVIGAPRKSVAAIHAQCWECGTTVGKVMIEGNEIRNSGYVGIFMPNQATVSNNFIVDSCMVLDDCGAIYTGGREFKSTGTRNNSLIEKNILVNVWGNPDGRQSNSTSAAQGIYLDDFSNTVTVTGNTVINADNGIQLHNAAENTVSNNTFYGSRRRAVWMQEDTLGSPGDIHDNVFSGNRYFQMNDEYTYRLDSRYNSINFATYNNNRYSLLYSEIIGLESYYPNGVQQIFSYPFQSWLVAKGEVASTALDTFAVAINRVVAVNSANLLSNSNFDTNTAGWVSWNSFNNGVIGSETCVTGLCLKYTSGTSHSILSSPKFLISKGKSYRVRMDVKGGQGNEELLIQLRLNSKAVDGSDSYAILGLSETKSLSDQWQTYSFVFMATDSSPVNGARLDLETPSANTNTQPVFYLDNVLVEEVSAEYSVATDGAAILTNPTLNAQSKSCPSGVTNAEKCTQYVRFSDGSAVSWPITLEAMGSEIVVWNNNPYKDTDRDQIADLNDLCTATPASTPVNEYGCSFIQQHSADLGITLAVASTALVGDTLTYTITVTNSGPLNATNVTTNGSLPGCALGTISKGGSATCSHTVSVNTASELKQTVNVSASEIDTVMANNSLTVTTTVLNKCAVARGKKISGTVYGSTGIPSSGVDMLLIRTSTTPQCGSRTTTTSYGYSFSRLLNATYSVMPSKGACSFTPINRTVTLSGTDIRGQNFSGSCP